MNFTSAIRQRSSEHYLYSSICSLIELYFIKFMWKCSLYLHSKKIQVSLAELVLAKIFWLESSCSKVN